jgi:peptide chain release factor 1
MTDFTPYYDEYERVTNELSDPQASSDPQLLRTLGKRQSELEPIVVSARRKDELDSQIQQTQSLLAGSDTAIAEMAKEELSQLTQERSSIEAKLEELLVPKDPYDERNVVVEIRPGAGGDESSLFAADLMLMYVRFAERQGWKVEILNESLTESGGFKEVIFSVSGTGAYAKLKYESGVHRVQRVPKTESQGRIHTSTATVAVLPEADEVDVQIDDADLRIDVFRSGGHGGQSVNTTDSAVRITHVPTGIVVTCQDEKSQLKNKLKAMGVLRSRLLAAELERREKEASSTRKSQIGTGDRSEKIRTYNFPQDRITDHRISLTIHGVAKVLSGDLDKIIEALEQAGRAQAAAE